MSKLTRNNLQLFCRICLTALRPTVENIYNIHLVPNLAKLLIFCTSLDVNEDDDILPNSLCQLCYDKLQDFQLFRSMAQQSAEVLNGIIKGKSEVQSLNCVATVVTNEEENYKAHPKCRENNCHHRADNYDESADDNQLLLPELSTQAFCEKSIKAEPIDTEYQRMQINQINVHLYNGNNCDNDAVKIKNEIDSEFDDTSNFYENNAIDNNYYSTEDDYGGDNDDEDDANTTSSFGRRRRNNSSLISLLHNSTSGRTALPRKRDRNKKALKCPLCEKQVYKQVYLDAHIRGIHEGHEKPFLCEQCSKAFTRYNQLHVHIQSSHLKNAKFVCEFDGCDAMFKLMTTLETHRKVVHTSDSAPSISLSLQRVLELHQAELSQENDVEHTCQQCFKKYSSKRALTEHLKRHANIKDHVCQVCGVAKVTRTELHTHMRTHEPNAEKFKCTICPQEFNHKNAIQRHIRVVHEGLRPFSCSFCPKRFGTRNSKMCHERLHTGERPFSCEICNKSFAQSEGLKSHMKNHDKSLRTHVCRFCFQRFITRKNLIDHEERHRGDKPHICDLCSRGFYKYADLLTHRKTHEDFFEMNRAAGSGGSASGSETYVEKSENIFRNSSVNEAKPFSDNIKPNPKLNKRDIDRNDFGSYEKSQEIIAKDNSHEDFMEEDSVDEQYVAGYSRELKESSSK